MSELGRYSLNDAEQRLARYLAQQRFEACRAIGATRGWQPTHDADVEGAAGEIAFARIHNIYPPTDIVHDGEWPTVDCVLHGIPVEVKACRYPNGRLLVPAARISKTAHVFALMVGEFPGPYRLAGFMNRFEMLSPHRLCDPGQGKAYGASQNELAPLSDVVVLTTDERSPRRVASPL